MSGPAWKLVVDGEVWDMSTLRVDAEAWMEKVSREEPYSRAEIAEATPEEYRAWRQWCEG